MTNNDKKDNLLNQMNASKNGNKIDQFIIGMILFIIIIIIGLYITMGSKILGYYWISGIALGFILQKSRFCFTSAIRDPYLIGITSLTKAVLIALAVTTVGFTIIKYNAMASGQIIPGQEYIRAISLSTVIGGILFGIGMVISSGCASGTLMRIGEGFRVHFITLIFFVIGSFWGIHDLQWWSNILVVNSQGIFLPDYMGWIGALLIQLVIISILYYFAHAWQNKKLNEDE